MSAHSSKRNPIYVALVDGDGNILGTTQNPLAASGETSGDAQPQHVLEPHTFENADGFHTGTMTSYAGVPPFHVQWTGGIPSEIRIQLPTGYFEANNPQEQVFILDSGYDESNIASGKSVFGMNGTFTADATAVAGDITSGKTAGVNGVMVTGTMEDLRNSTIGGTLDNSQEGQITVTPTGWDGRADPTTKMTVDDVNFLAENIKNGVTIFGITGTYTGP